MEMKCDYNIIVRFYLQGFLLITRQGSLLQSSHTDEARECLRTTAFRIIQGGQRIELPLQTIIVNYCFFTFSFPGENMRDLILVKKFQLMIYVLFVREIWSTDYHTFVSYFRIFQMSTIPHVFGLQL